MKKQNKLFSSLTLDLWAR